MIRSVTVKSIYRVILLKDMTEIEMGVVSSCILERAFTIKLGETLVTPWGVLTYYN